MRIITSKDNKIYKSAVKLLKKKYRDQTGMYLIEGVKPIDDAIAAEAKLKQILIRAESADDVDMEHWGGGSAGVYALQDDLFEELSSTETSQGVVGVAEKKRFTPEDFERAVSDGNILVMDGIQDPGNIGTIIRTAEGAGYRGIMSVNGSGDVYAPKVVRAAAGSLFRMPVMTMADPEEAIGSLIRMNKKIVVSCPGEGVSCFDADMTDNIGLVIGNEGSGVSGRFIEAADIKVNIPMKGTIESLNAAVAAGILMYQTYV